jgi:hypothetical protein
VTFIRGISVLFPGFLTSFLFMHAVELSVQKLSITVHRSDSEGCTLHTFIAARLLGVRSDSERCTLHTIIAARLLRVFDRLSGDTSVSSLRSSIHAHLSRTISCFIVRMFILLIARFGTTFDRDGKGRKDPCKPNFQNCLNTDTALNSTEHDTCPRSKLCHHCKRLFFGRFKIPFGFTFRISKYLSDSIPIPMNPNQGVSINSPTLVWFGCGGRLLGIWVGTWGRGFRCGASVFWRGIRLLVSVWVSVGLPSCLDRALAHRTFGFLTC